MMKILNMQKARKALSALKIWLLRRYYPVRRILIPPTFPKNKDGKVYVNLGCGVNTSGEYINVDAVAFPHTHYLSTIENLHMFPDNSIDLLYASHVIEHIPRGQLKAAFDEWYRVLKVGGIFRFGVPDFDKLIEVYQLSGHKVDSIVNQLLGQDAPYDDHHTLWNFQYAEELLNEAGFKDIKIWDYRNVENRNFNDKTSRIIEVGGRKILISLNIEAKKAIKR